MRWHVAVALVCTGALGVVVGGKPSPRVRIGAGPGPACELPARACSEHCADLVQIPAVGAGYVDVRLDDEQTAETSTSYVRRDLMMLVQYAAAKVACKANGWSTGHGGPIALSDMSERDGATPGTARGSPRHPRGTHVGGRDIDIAYFQRGTLDNQLRPICPHRTAAGLDQHRCLAAPSRLDAYRTALFIGALLEEPQVRAIGIDGRAARPILAALDELCASGWLEPAACRADRIRFETTDSGHGWFRGHHNHLHVSWRI
jgi:hypothetical protein